MSERFAEPQSMFFPIMYRSVTGNPIPGGEFLDAGNLQGIGRTVDQHLHNGRFAAGQRTANRRTDVLGPVYELAMGPNPSAIRSRRTWPLMMRSDHPPTTLLRADEHADEAGIRDTEQRFEALCLEQLQNSFMNIHSHINLLLARFSGAGGNTQQILL